VDLDTRPRKVEFSPGAAAPHRLSACSQVSGRECLDKRYIWMRELLLKRFTSWRPLAFIDE
jgi:hypothetical protein